MIMIKQILLWIIITYFSINIILTIWILLVKESREHLLSEENKQPFLTILASLTIGLFVLLLVDEE